MGMQIKSGLGKNYVDRDVYELFEIMQDAIDRLDTLGQIQSAVGGLSMGSRARDTFECRARLDHKLSELRAGFDTAD